MGPNLPIDFPAHTACTSAAAVAKSILNLAHEPQVLEQGLVHLDEVLRRPEPLHKPMEEPGGSILLHELVGNLPDRQYAIEQGINKRSHMATAKHSRSQRAGVVSGRGVLVVGA